MDYEIAIPTYERVNILKNKTWKLLQKHEIPVDSITLFVEDIDQYNKYRDEFDDVCIVITNTTGIGAKRNFIRKYYRDRDTKWLFCMDDDVIDIGDQFGSLNPKSLNNMIIECFDKCDLKDLCFWSIGLGSNRYWRSDTISMGNKYIYGALHGIIIKKDKPLIQTDMENLYEDMDFAIKHFLRDGAVLRFNKYGFTHANVYDRLKGEGGIAMHIEGGLSKNRAILMERLGEDFHNKYPELTKRVKKKYGLETCLNPYAKHPTFNT